MLTCQARKVRHGSIMGNYGIDRNLVGAGPCARPFPREEMRRMGKGCAGFALLLLTSGERSGNIGNIVKLDFLRWAEKMDFFLFSR